MRIQKKNLDKYKNSKGSRRLYIQDNTPEQEYGKMAYTEPNMNQISRPMMDSQKISEQPIPSYNEEDEIYERNQGTLNIGSSRDDYEYRPIVNPRRSQNYGNEYYDIKSTTI